MSEDLRERDGTNPLKEGTIGNSLYKCRAVALKVSMWMREKSSIYRCKETGRYYFRLSKDPRPRLAEELLDV